MVNMIPWQHICMGLLVICGIILSTTEAQVPVDGGWSVWGEWIVGSCPVTCGGSTTQRHRTRECTNPLPANGGETCPGFPFEYESFNCGDELCTVPVNGGWSMWGEWIVGPCPVTCGGLTAQRHRTRECTNPPAANGGADCPGLPFEYESFSCGDELCTVNLTVPVNGGWSMWGEWIVGSCPVTCGGSKTRRLRIRECTNPPAANGGADCPGLYYVHESFSCGDELCTVNGSWSMWGEWIVGPCPVTCGGSTAQRNRTRECTNPLPANGGADCPGLPFELESFSCGNELCTVDGEWSNWNEWTTPDCPVTCGGSVVNQTRTRQCNSRPPLNGGSSCPGLDSDFNIQPCGVSSCPGTPQNGSWSDWSQWSDTQCSVTCGGGRITRTRTRRCDDPAPQNGGFPCSGENSESDSQICGSQTCPVDGGWSRWGEWGSLHCTATCGGSVMGTSTRRRTCSDPVPKYGGRACAGSHEENQNLDCKLNDCPAVSGVPEWYAALPEAGQRAVIGVIIAVGVFLLLLIIFVICLLCQRKKRSETRPPLLSPENQEALPKGSTSGTASRAMFKDGRWNQAFNNPP